MEFEQWALVIVAILSWWCAIAYIIRKASPLYPLVVVSLGVIWVPLAWSGTISLIGVAILLSPWLLAVPLARRRHGKYANLNGLRDHDGEKLRDFIIVMCGATIAMLVSVAILIGFLA